MTKLFTPSDIPTGKRTKTQRRKSLRHRRTKGKGIVRKTPAPTTLGGKFETIEQRNRRSRTQARVKKFKKHLGADGG